MKLRLVLGIISFVTGITSCASTNIDGEVELPKLDMIAFGSCNVQSLPQTFWTQIYREHPDLFIYGGDNIYGDLEYIDGAASVGNGRPELLRAAYKDLGSAPEFKAFREKFPVYPIWDDHDYGEDDAGATYTYKLDSEKQFLDFWHVSGLDDRRNRPGIYTSSIHGPKGERVQIILLDTRYFRSDLKTVTGEQGSSYVPNSDLSTTLLGQDQWNWLSGELKKEADVRLIVSTIQVLADGHEYERWGNFPHERSKLFHLIRESKSNGVIFLSGDRHSSAIYSLPIEGSYTITEMTSSGLNYPMSNPSEKGPNQITPMFDKANYSTISFNWDSRNVALAIKDMEGEIVRSVNVSIDELR